MKKTKEQIAAEIAALESLKPLSRRYSAFGDDHHRTIDMQVLTLKRGWGYDDIADLESDDYGAASDAIAWRDGESDEIESLAAEYEHLK